VFEVESRKTSYVFPYAAAQPRPSASNRVVEVYPDPDLGREAFTYRLGSGAEGSVHIDSVLEHNQDPSYLADLMLYKLTVAARSRLKRATLSLREVSRRLETSPSQIYRLLDPANYAKSVRQMLSLLSVLGCDVDLVVKDRAGRRAFSRMAG
jgi:hypothetical protein